MSPSFPQRNYRAVDLAGVEVTANAGPIELVDLARERAIPYQHGTPALEPGDLVVVAVLAPQPPGAQGGRRLEHHAQAQQRDHRHSEGAHGGTLPGRRLQRKLIAITAGRGTPPSPRTAASHRAKLA